MTDTNQKLREALQAIANIDDTTNHSVDASAALDHIGEIARQALALPTEPAHADTWGISRALVTLYAYECDGLTDEALAIPAAPVGELPELPEHIGQIIGIRHTPEDTSEFWGYFADGFKTDKKQCVFTADQMRAYAREAMRKDKP